MTWHPSDFVSDVDLVAYEADILTRFGQVTWRDRIDRVLEDWLFPHLEVAGFPPERLKTRTEPAAVFGYTGSVYTSYTGAAVSTGTTLDLPLATVFATVGTDALYVGSAVPFRGIVVGLLDNVSAVVAGLTVAVWTGAWTPQALSDATSNAGKAFAQGGSVTWAPPSTWTPRALNGTTAYWAKVTTSATPTAGTTAATLSCIGASRLRGPAALRTLALIFREAPSAQDGPWVAKADWYEKEADAALTRALPLLGGEFDTDASEVLSSTEQAQTAAEVTGAAGGWRLERG